MKIPGTDYTWNDNTVKNVQNNLIFPFHCKINQTIGFDYPVWNDFNKTGWLK